MSAINENKDALFLWTKFDTKSGPYSPEEIEAAANLSHLENPFFRLIGRLVLFDSSEPSIIKFEELIRTECDQVVVGDELYTTNMLYLQFSFSASSLLSEPMAKFIFDASQSASVRCRLNSSQLLGKMATISVEARKRLHELCTDSDPQVRKNAEIFLRKINDSQRL